jgi:hypothetical protein
MNAVEHRLSEAVKDLLAAHKPEEVPAAFGIRAAHDTAKLEKPYIVAATENGSSLHKKMRKCELVLTSYLREGEAATAPEEETHQRFVNVLEANMEELVTRLAEVGLKLRKISDGATGEEIENGRTTASSTGWTMCLEIVG